MEKPEDRSETLPEFSYQVIFFSYTPKRGEPDVFFRVVTGSTPDELEKGFEKAQLDIQSKGGKFLEARSFSSEEINRENLEKIAADLKKKSEKGEF